MMAKEIAISMKYFDKIDLLDDNSALAIGCLTDYKKYSGEYAYTAVAIGDADIRLRWIEKLSKTFLHVAILISPQAYVSPSAVVKKGSIIEPMAVIQTNTELSVGVIVSAGAVVGHNVFIGDGCHINCGFVVRPNSVILAGTKMGFGEVAGQDKQKFLKDKAEATV